MKRVEASKHTVRIGGEEQRWSRLWCEITAQSVCRVDVHRDSEPDGAVVVLYDNEVIFTGVVRRAVERERGVWEVKAESSGWKIHEEVPVMSWRNVGARRVIEDIANVLGIQIDVSTVPEVVLEWMSVERGWDLGAVLEQWSDGVAGYVEGRLGWYWNAADVLCVGQLDDMESTRVSIAGQDVKQNIAGVFSSRSLEVLPRVVRYNDIVEIEGRETLVIREAVYIVEAGERNTLYVEGQSLW